MKWEDTTLVIVGLYFLLVGLKVLITRKPLLLNARWFLCLMVLLLLPAIIAQYINATKELDASFDFKYSILLAIIIAYLIYSRINFHGFFAIGVTKDSFRSAIHKALEKLKIPFQETRSHIKLPSLNADLRVSVYSWSGTGLVRLKGSHDPSVLLKKIIDSIVQYYKTTDVKANIIGVAYDIAIALIFFILFVARLLIH